MDSIVELVEEATGRKTSSSSSVIRNWVPIEYTGFNFHGRYVPENEYSDDIFDKGKPAQPLPALLICMHVPFHTHICIYVYTPICYANHPHTFVLLVVVVFI
jgi:hypothetical protein